MTARNLPVLCCRKLGVLALAAGEEVHPPCSWRLTRRDAGWVTQEADDAITMLCTGPVGSPPPVSLGLVGPGGTCHIDELKRWFWMRAEIRTSTLFLRHATLLACLSVSLDGRPSPGPSQPRTTLTLTKNSAYSQG